MVHICDPSSRPTLSQKTNQTKTDKGLVRLIFQLIFKSELGWGCSLLVGLLAIHTTRSWVQFPAPQGRWREICFLVPDPEPRKPCMPGKHTPPVTHESLTPCMLRCDLALNLILLPPEQPGLHNLQQVWLPHFLFIFWHEGPNLGH